MSRSPIQFLRISGAFVMIAALGFARVGSATQGGGAAASGISAEDLKQAGALFEEARAVRAKDPAKALKLMQRSYDLSLRPWLLYNLADLAEKVGECSRALAAYERYLREDQDGSYRAKAELRVGELRPKCGEEAATPVRSFSPPPTPVPPAAPPPSASSNAGVVIPPPPKRDPVPVEPPGYWTPQRILGGGLAAGGALSAGVAIFYGVSAVRHDDDLGDLHRESRARAPENRPLWSESAQSIADDRDADEARAIAFMLVSGALIGVGVTLILVAPDARAVHGERQEVALRLGPGSFALECTANAF